jgi:hypothetical protein
MLGDRACQSASRKRSDTVQAAERKSSQGEKK